MSTTQKSTRDVDTKPLVRQIFEATSEKEVSGQLQPDIDLSILESLGAKINTGKRNMKLDDYKEIYQKLNEVAAMTTNHPELEELTNYLTILGGQLKRVMFA